MKVVVVGGTGTIGQAIVSELSSRHNVIVVGGQHGDYQVDMASPESIEKMYRTITDIDAVICAAGQVHFGALETLTAEEMDVGLKSKLMGQINLVLIGLKYIHQAGSFTLTSGILSHDPIRYGVCASMVNGAIDSFVKGASIEMPKQVRINAVSPTIVTESLDKFADYFRGFESVPAKRVALAYSKSVEGAQTGQVYPVV